MYSSFVPQRNQHLAWLGLLSLRFLQQRIINSLHFVAFVSLSISVGGIHKGLEFRLTDWCQKCGIIEAPIGVGLKPVEAVENGGSLAENRRAPVLFSTAVSRLASRLHSLKNSQ